MKWKQLLLIVGVSAASAVGSVWTYGKLTHEKTAFVQSTNGKLPVNYAGFNENIAGAPADAIDFTKAANAAVPAVVHIKTKIPAKKISNDLPRSRRNSAEDWFEQFFNFGPQIQPEQRASGSGVIISDDGYIVTNNHVISDGGAGVADEITVTLSNKKVYKAKVIGKDPSSDLAVLKIDGTNFPYMIYGNSDNLKLAQWVLAVGYPLTLETTVTAGIVSAKGRAIGINARQSQTPIESFIQTDAAVNQGNSGGALITTDGQLVGINSAILAPSGTYAGYSFAIPVNLVKKIVNDLIKFGDVKRPYLGVQADETKVEAGGGAHIGAVPKDGAAASIGLRKGDIITGVNDIPVNSWSELQGTIASYNAGDKVKISYKRDGKDYTGTVTLSSQIGTYDETASNSSIGEMLGADLETLDKKKAEQYEVDGGVVVKKIKEGGSISRTRMQEGFVILSVNGQDVPNVQALGRLLSAMEGTVQLEGIYPGYDGTYRYPLNLESQ
ncbi:trypsin-like peptidase domain-containing protein [Terrimonas pollutisoli]|uniref:trypsin-like peptidase domain-containing protein n=1 Tax=Terrimonas pollutisoli TaxID=3034147 RepID=UPI0023EAF879|nr:trypsin-like peptidase domain-containing protein [Terrimonas sp. H1YJ31]